MLARCSTPHDGARWEAAEGTSGVALVHEHNVRVVIHTELRQTHGSGLARFVPFSYLLSLTSALPSRGAFSLFIADQGQPWAMYLATFY